MKLRDRLDTRTVQEIEQFLKEKLAELKKSVRSAMTQQFTSEASRPADSTAWAIETLEDEMRAELVDRRSRQLAHVEAALERLNLRQYGMCSDCGEFIGLARLRAMPFAQRCRPCQSLAEREARPEPRRVSSFVAVADD